MGRGLTGVRVGFVEGNRLRLAVVRTTRDPFMGVLWCAILGHSRCYGGSCCQKEDVLLHVVWFGKVVWERFHRRKKKVLMKLKISRRWKGKLYIGCVPVRETSIPS